jgi:3-methylcrotonyl-CoA carboxylase alpha subunit
MTNGVRIADGAYRVETDGQWHLVYVAGTPANRWAFWNGRVYRGAQIETASAAPSRPRLGTHQKLTAPMPATVLKVLVTAGSQVKKGETLVILEAMKMELPLRAPADATVTAVACREGELVQPDAVLVELE